MSIFDLRIDTARLLLRPTAAEDFEPWVAFAADPVVMQHLGGVQPRAMAWRMFTGMAGAWHLHGFAMFSVIEKSSGRWIGRIGPWRPEGWPGTEVGWSLIRDAWGKGYAAEAATAAIDWAFAELGWTDVIHTISPANVESKALAARLDSRYLRMSRLPAPHDLECELWGQSREEWVANAVKRAGR
jgi:RimJ/RimL family protein N-acetyltransferase